MKYTNKCVDLPSDVYQQIVEKQLSLILRLFSLYQYIQTHLK